MLESTSTDLRHQHFDCFAMPNSHIQFSFFFYCSAKSLQYMMPYIRPEIKLLVSFLLLLKEVAAVKPQAPILEECFKGNGEAATAWCHEAGSNRDCCVGENACIWPTAQPDQEDGTVCTGSCNGDYACQQNYVKIGSNSCKGDYACVNFGTIGSDSCNYGNACTSNSASIGSNSCTGLFACLSNSGDIGSDSCNNDHSCKANSGDTIGSGSCNFEWACYAQSGTIGDVSCNAKYACELNTGHLTPGGDIGSDSCNGDYACRANKGTVAEMSCNAERACYANFSAIGVKKCKVANACCVNDACYNADTFLCLNN
jgi:hypothetical protein